MSTGLPFPFPSPFGSGFSFLPSTGGSALGNLNPTIAQGASGQYDQMIDPITLDYVRTDNGEWAETADSRSIVLVALEVELAASPFDPSHGTAIKSLIRSGDPLTPEVLRAETERVMADLATEGVLANARVAVRDEHGAPLVDQNGTQVVSTSWRDLASGSPVNLLLQQR